MTSLINALLLALTASAVGASLERVAPNHAASAPAPQQRREVMRQGRTIVELAQEIQRQSETKKDFVGDTRNMQMRVREVEHNGASDLDELLAKPVQSRTVNEGEKATEIVMGWGNGERQEMPVTETAHSQIRDRLRIPAKYYNRLMVDHPELLAHNVSELMQREPATRMLRTLDNTLRAYLSDSYRILDNDALFEAIYPVLMALGVQIVSAEITPKRLYIKFLCPSVKVDAPDLLPPNVSRIDPHGDALTPDAVIKHGEFAGYKISEIVAGGVISNSEIGFSRMKVEKLRFFSRCLNGWIDVTAMAKTHLGSKVGTGEIESSQYFKDETRLLDDAATFGKLRDTVEGMFNPADLNEWVAKARAAKQDKVEDPTLVAPMVEVVGNRLALTDNQRKGVLASLIQDGDLSRWGVSNAITAISQKVEDYDQATDLEAEGGKVVQMEKRNWNAILEEAKKLAA